MLKKIYGPINLSYIHLILIMYFIFIQHQMHVQCQLSPIQNDFKKAFVSS